MYKSRNPFTPEIWQHFSPKEYLTRYLNFKLWDINNPVAYSETCLRDKYFYIWANNMCCIPHLKQLIDGRYLDLAGCRAGIWVEPIGFQDRLVLALKRLEELEGGQSDSIFWNIVLFGKGTEAWIYDTPEDKAPGFSLLTFKRVCKKYGYWPNFSQVATCFGESIFGVLDFWFTR